MRTTTISTAVVALTANLVVLTALPAGATIPTWDSAGDFLAGGNHSNAVTDTWQYFRAPTGSHDPTSYTLLDTFDEDGCAQANGIVDEWTQGGAVPIAVKNLSANTVSCATAAVPGGSFDVHPAPTEDSVIGWMSPFSGVVAVSGSVTDADGNGGDGVVWSLDHDATALASGTVLDDNAQPGTQNALSDGVIASGTDLSHVAVEAGEFLYLHVAAGAGTSTHDYTFDNTLVDLSVTHVVGSVSDVHVTPNVTSGGGVTVNLTWVSDPDNAGTRICERPGAVADADPTACAQHADVPVTGGGPPLPAVQKNKQYTFTLFGYDGSGDYSPGVSATLAGATASMTGATKIRYGAAVTLATVLRRAPGGAPLAGRPVSLWAIGPSAGAVWHRVASRTTDSVGAAQVRVKPTRNTTYQWRFRGAPDDVMATTSTAKLVRVAYAVSAALTRSSVHVGQAFGIYGVVRPAQAGGLVYLERRVSGSWQTTATRVRQALQTLPDGRHVVGYLFTLKASRAGTFHLRVLRPGTLANVAGISRALTLVVS
jgi:hypothetical protein